VNGVCWACGLGPTVRLGNRTLIVRGRTIADYAVVEAEILKERSNVYDLIRRTAGAFSDSPERQRDVCRFLVESAGRRWSRTTMSDVVDWINTWRGRVFLLWLAVRENDPAACPLERVAREAQRADWSEIAAAMEQASGADERCHDACSPFFDDKQERPISWPPLFRRLAASPFHLGPAEVGRLTMQQVRYYLSDERLLGDDLQFDSFAQLARWRRDLASSAERVVDNLVNGRRRDSSSEGEVQ
jgi:hypothetical protein